MLSALGLKTLPFSLGTRTLRTPEERGAGGEFVLHHPWRTRAKIATAGLLNACPIGVIAILGGRQAGFRIEERIAQRSRAEIVVR